MRVYHCRVCRYPVTWCSDDVVLDAVAIGHYWVDGAYHRDVVETALPTVLPPQAWRGTGSGVPSRDTSTFRNPTCQTRSRVRQGLRST